MAHKGDGKIVKAPISLRCTSLTGLTDTASASMQAAMLIPIGVIMYTCAGGLKATFIASYVHTVILYLALCIFSLTVYTTCPDLGSPSKVRVCHVPVSTSWLVRTCVTRESRCFVIDVKCKTVALGR